MFLPEVTNIRLPAILAPVVMPTSCLIEPRYSTLSDMTASPAGGVVSLSAGGSCGSGGSGGTGRDWAEAGTAAANSSSAASRNDLMQAPTHAAPGTCAGQARARSARLGQLDRAA